MAIPLKYKQSVADKATFYLGIEPNSKICEHIIIILIKKLTLH